MTAREHARLLGLLFWIYVGIQIVLMIFSFIFMTAMFGRITAEFLKMPRGADAVNPEMFVGIMGVAMVFAIIIAIVVLIPKVVAGYGLRNDKSWSKVWAIVASILALLSFPLGTALGIYGLWFIFGDKGKEYFDNNHGNVQTPPPPPNSWQ